MVFDSYRAWPVILGSDPNFRLASPKQAAGPHRKLGSDPNFTGNHLRRLAGATRGASNAAGNAFRVGGECHRAADDAAALNCTFS